MDAYPLPTNRTAPFTAFPLAPRLDTDAEPRKKLVPKKSKLALLAAGTKNLGKDKFRSKNKADDLSDVVRRVGAGSSSTGGFEIYVDHCEDADDASILMVKKKKSRAALDDVQWGPSALGEVTNVASNPGASSALPKEPKPIVNTLKIPTKADENQNSKWWNVSIGRGRKDAKEKIPVRSKSKFCCLDSDGASLITAIVRSPRAFQQTYSRHWIQGSLQFARLEEVTVVRCRFHPLLSFVADPDVSSSKR